MQFPAVALKLPLTQIFATDTHFPKIIKLCSGHPKTCKSIKKRKSKICTKIKLFSVYEEENKKMVSVIFLHPVVNISQEHPTNGRTSKKKK